MIKSEMRRILRSWYYWLITGLIWFFTALGAALVVFLASNFDGPEFVAPFQQAFLGVMLSTGSPLFVVLGGVVVTRDFGSRYVLGLTLYCGGRTRLMFYKMAALLVPALIMVILNGAIIIASMLVAASVFGIPLDYGDAYSWWLAVIGVVLPFISVYFGFFLGWLFRSTLIFALVWLIWVYVAESVISLALARTYFSSWTGVLPGISMQGAVGKVTGFYDWVYFLIFCGWTILAAVFGTLRTKRQSLV